MGTQGRLTAEAALKNVLDSQQRQETQINQLQRSNEELRSENIALKEEMKKYKGYEDLFREEKTKRLQVWVRDPFVVRALLKRLREAYGRAAKNLDSQGEAGKSMRITVDRFVENCIKECCVRRWGDFQRLYLMDPKDGTTEVAND